VASRESTARREHIVSLAQSNGTANVEELAAHFGVSLSTIRRDLATLTGSGKVARTYGGAIALTGHQELSLRQRIGEAYREKHGIALWARQQVQSGDSVLLDAGSTVGALAHELRLFSKLTVTTASLSVVDELSEVESVTVQCLGGRLRRLSQSFVGPLTEGALEHMTFDRAFLGADAVDAVRGICEADLEQTRLKELIARRADRTYVLADSRKVGARPFHAWTTLAKPWTLVTDSNLDEDQLASFSGQGIEVVVTDFEGNAVRRIPGSPSAAD
jgi:DeoR/GlpR family transcriptional regulator of sugar metabolism